MRAFLWASTSNQCRRTPTPPPESADPTAPRDALYCWKGKVSNARVDILKATLSAAKPNRIAHAHREATMTNIIEATYDGKVFRPDKPVRLQPNTHVTITIEVDKSPDQPKQNSFLQTARSLKLNGPSDWAENIDHYLENDR